MTCVICGNWVDWLYDNPPEEYTCRKCIGARYESDVARHRTKRILNRLKVIEKALPDSTNPAKLRLERSELDGELEKIEGAAG